MKTCQYTDRKFFSSVLIEIEKLLIILILLFTHECLVSFLSCKIKSYPYQFLQQINHRINIKLTEILRTMVDNRFLILFSLCLPFYLFASELCLIV